MNPFKKTFTLGTQQVTLETGEIARQAHGAVLCTVDDTVVLATGAAAAAIPPSSSPLPPSSAISSLIAFPCNTASTLSVASIVARWMAFSSSRTFPG